MILAALASGALIGAILAGLGAGGSILMTPLLVYGVGVCSAHAAVGTSAVAVTLNALVGLAGHARAGTVWSSAVLPCWSSLSGSPSL
ncbi:MAG: TSUP family transporter [Novosphingobium sp.]